MRAIGREVKLSAELLFSQIGVGKPSGLHWKGLWFDLSVTGYYSRKEGCTEGVPSGKPLLMLSFSVVFGILRIMPPLWSGTE
jgi:hypothetical protein